MQMYLFRSLILKVMRWLDLEMLSRILEGDVVPELVRWNSIVMENHN